MTVVFRESTRKMTPKCGVALILAFIWIEGLSAASFSNVLVQRGPLEYINYNPSALSFSPQLAQLSAGSLEEVVPLPAVSSIMSPCVAPCIIPNGPIQALATLPSTANAKIVTYKSSLPSSAPVLLANKDVPRGYQYAYAVFDEQTGDKKTQSEQSDGSVVHGQYSFIQPDGFRRVVVYTADDLKGFNAVVKNISPESDNPIEETHEAPKEEVKPPSPPCTEAKNEHLTEIQASQEEVSVENNVESEHIEEKKSEEKSEEIVEISTEKIIETVEESHEEEQPHEDAPPEEETQPNIENADQNTNIPNDLISYNDIINCLQAKLKGARNVISPLTYVLIPSSRSPC